MLAGLVASYQIRNLPRKFTENCFAIFDQPSSTIYITWYRLLLFFRKFSSVISYMIWLQDSSQIKRRGCICMSSIPYFIFLIRAEQFWIWFSWKLTKNVKISIVFEFFSNFIHWMTFNPFIVFLFWRYLDLTEGHFSSGILVPFSDSSNLYSRVKLLILVNKQINIQIGLCSIFASS